MIYYHLLSLPTIITYSNHHLLLLSIRWQSLSMNMVLDYDNENGIIMFIMMIKDSNCYNDYHDLSCAWETLIREPLTAPSIRHSSSHYHWCSMAIKW